jgi:hypothetical protein
MINEIVFLIEESPEGGYTARALGYSIFTEADNWNELREAVRDSIKCHFEASDMPKVIRLHYVRDEVLVA